MCVSVFSGFLVNHLSENATLKPVLSGWKRAQNVGLHFKGCFQDIQHRPKRFGAF